MRTRVIVLLALSAVLIGIGTKLKCDAKPFGAEIIELEMPKDQAEFDGYVQARKPLMEQHVQLDYAFIAGYVLLFILYNLWVPGPRQAALASIFMIVAAGAFDVGEDLAMLDGSSALGLANAGRITMLAAAKWLAFFIAVEFLGAKMDGRLRKAVIYASSIAAVISVLASAVPLLRRGVQLATTVVLVLLIVHLVQVFRKSSGSDRRPPAETLP